MKPMNSAGRAKQRRLEALDRRLEDIATLEGGEIPGLDALPHGLGIASRIIKEKLLIAHADVENIKRKG